MILTINPFSSGFMDRLRAFSNIVCNEKISVLYGFTLIELMVVIATMGILISISIPAYNDYITKVKNVRAIAEIRIIEKEIAFFILEYDRLPKDLEELGFGDLKDPWGNPYEYLNFEYAKNEGHMRKDRFLVPINTDYDLYSMGKDGESTSPLTADISYDDIIRGNNGNYIGLASGY